MVEELERMGIKLMVSVWPDVDPYSENYAEMRTKGVSHTGQPRRQNTVSLSGSAGLL